jgi:hypothetical protein
VSHVPDFLLEIDGAPAPAELRACVTSVRHTSSLEGADRVEIGLANQGLRWLDHPLLVLDNEVKLSLGWVGELEQVFVGEIISRDASFPSSGAPTLVVCAQDKRHRLAQGTKDRWFAIPIPSVGNIPLPDQAVATFVTLENGMLPIFDPVGAALAVILGGIDAVAIISDPSEGQKLVKKQVSESDYDFLARVGRENGWEMVVEHSGALGGHLLRFFSSMDQLEVQASYRYGESLIEFTPRISSVGQLVSVGAHVYVSEIKMMFLVTVGWDWDRMSLTLAIVPSIVPLMPQAPKTFEFFGPMSPYSSARKIVGNLLPRLNNRLSGSGSVVGNAAIRAGRVLRIEGVGSEFGGLYRVKQAEHQIDGSGYITRFDVRKEVWFGSIPLPEQGAVPIQAQLPGVP